MTESMVSFFHDVELNIHAETVDVQACRRVVDGFLRIEKKHKVCATYNVTGRLFKEEPELIEKILQAGHEVAFHSYNHQSDWRPKYYRAEVELCRQTSRVPKGYRSPRSGCNRATLKALWDNGLLWSAEGDNEQEPYFIYEGVVRLPIAGDDWRLHRGELSEDEWVEGFERLLGGRRYMGFGCHDYIASAVPDKRLAAWERVLALAIEKGALIVSCSEAADMFRRAALAKYYSETASDWDEGVGKLYRTKRFQELLGGEAENLDRPVVADLGSGSGALTNQLTDIAEKVYCVDNAAGMVAKANAKEGLEGRLGEVTASTLSANSCDLVVCARVIEYLFWPDRLADEIKRIGKTGGTYFVTFPAYRGKASLREDTPPGRIRRYFTAAEIHEWASQIGPWRLIGVQYERPEPGDAATEKAYRDMEEHPPESVAPTNWVYIGTIRHPYRPGHYRQLGTGAGFDFQFPKVRRTYRWTRAKRILRMPLGACRRLVRLTLRIYSGAKR